MSSKHAKMQFKSQPASDGDDSANNHDGKSSDSHLFEQTMASLSGVKRMESDRADLRQPIQRKRKKDINHDTRQAAAVTAPEVVIDHLSSEAVSLLDSSDEMIFAAPGVQLGLLQKLKKGHIPWDRGIDLHGLTVDEARDALSHFIRTAAYENCRCLIVVHGKGLTQASQGATLKSYTNEWLRRLSPVVAFASAQPKDGGTGAVYVLLKRPDSQREANKRNYRQR